MIVIRSYAARWILDAFVFTCFLGVLRYKPWHSNDLGSSRP